MASMLPALLALALLADPAREAGPTPPAGGSVILFLIDNSASLPPLDPSEKRVVALERIFTFLQGQQYRLILFGGRSEIFVDEVSRYHNDGRWTDFYHAFRKAQELAESYPESTVFRMVLLTDAIADPDPEDWKDVPPGWEPRSHSIRKTIELLSEMRIPLYVVLVGQPPSEGAQGAEQSPGFVLDMVRASNGAAAAPLAQSLASFFADDGMLLKKFVYRVAPNEGLRRIEPVIRRIAAPPRPATELRMFSYFVLPLVLVLLVLLGVLVHSYPGPGDLEIVELAVNQPVHVAVDKLSRSASGVWSAQGLSLLPDSRGAAATFTLQTASLELTGLGLDLGDLDPRDRALLPLGLDEMRRALESATESGTRDEKIHALNLDYAARSLRAEEAERILTRPTAERARMAAIDFVRAKAHLATSDALRQKLLAPRLQFLTHGAKGARREVTVSDSLRIGRYRFLVREIARGGRKDARLVLYYDRVPSLFGLKTILPDMFQRLFRFRRSTQRIVS